MELSNLILLAPCVSNELQFREFLVFDANNDGYLDILLRPFTMDDYTELIRFGGCHASKGIKLNHLIWVNNGHGTFYT